MLAATGGPVPAAARAGHHSVQEALMADAATMVVDGVTYGLNFWAEWSKVGKSPRHQLWLDVVPPLVSVVALVAVTVWVMIDSVKSLNRKRGDDEDDVNVTVMWVFATINLVLDFANLAM
jgi:Co/Zn/Cd efflux system component